jgi:hypothetical protein
MKTLNTHPTNTYRIRLVLEAVTADNEVYAVDIRELYASPNRAGVQRAFDAVLYLAQPQPLDSGIEDASL